MGHHLRHRLGVQVLTAAAVAMLVDDGKVQWEDRATQDLQGVQLYDPYVTARSPARPTNTERVERGELCVRHGVHRGDPARVVPQPTGEGCDRRSATRTSVHAAPARSRPRDRPAWDDARERIFTPLAWRVSESVCAQSSQRAAPTREARHVRAVRTPHATSGRRARSIKRARMASGCALQLGQRKFEGKHSPAPRPPRRRAADHPPGEGVWGLLLPSHFVTRAGMVPPDTRGARCAPRWKSRDDTLVAC